MNITSPFAITGASAVITVLAIVVAVALSRRKARDLKRRRIVRNACAVVAAIGCIALASLGVVYAQGTAHGMTGDDWRGRSIGEVISLNATTPENQSLPDDATGSVVILYKYGCPDCEAIYGELASAIDEAGIEDVYYVASSSPDGRELVENGSINYVPTVVYLRHEALANGADMTHIQLTTVDEDGNTVLDTAALQRIALLQQQGR